MIEALSGFAASLIFVFLKAFQQRNVAFDHYRWVIPTSMAMAFTEFYVIALIVKAGYNLPLVGAIGLGAGVGAVAAIHIHGRFLGGANGKTNHINTSTSMTAQGVTEVKGDDPDGHRY